MKNIFYPIFVLLLLLSACRKDIDETFTDLDIYESPVIQVDAMTSMGGRVVDENGTPIADALVSLAGRTTSTNFFGLFDFSSMMLNQSGSFIKVEKEGYFNGSHRFFPADNSSNSVEITLLEFVPVGTFSSQTGGTVNTMDGVSVEFPEDAIMHESGTPYSGEVTVNAVWLDPTRKDLLEIMPGNLQGISEEDEEVALESFGMIGVELRGGGSNKLQIKTGKSAKISIPVPLQILSKAPSEIPLWSFDETTGIWKEEAKAKLIDGAYVGEVSHFSFWNCDVPFPLAAVTGRLVNSTGGVVANAKVRVRRANDGYSAYSYSNNSGTFGGKVPMNEALTLEVEVPGGCSYVFEYPFGPIVQNSDLGDITIPSTFGNIETMTIRGTLVDCNGSPVEKGWVSASFGMGNASSFYVEGTGGEFEFSVLRCAPNDLLTITGFDINNGASGFPLTFSDQLDVDLGAYEVCGNSLLGFVSVEFGEEEFFISGAELTLTDRVAMTDLFERKDGGIVVNTTSHNFRLNLLVRDLATLGVGTFTNEEDEVLVRCPIRFDSEKYGGLVERTFCDVSICEDYETFALTQAGGTIGEFLTGYYTATISVIVDQSIYVDNIPLRVDFSLRVNYEE